ncbi:cytidine deaminase 1-like [Bidens hawaiensis]|uniref:cytidine deaminase 1-like n=1 Tax=Bidens hawaiensis TaxID=980011 RepID=UPI00404A9DAC
MNQQAPKYVFSSAESEEMSKTQNLSLPHLLPSLVNLAQTLARPPISNRPVDAAGILSDDRIFLGANVEFPGLPVYNSIHAEQFLIANIAARNADDTKLVYAAVSAAATCGHCIQFPQHVNGTQILEVTYIQFCSPNLERVHAALVAYMVGGGGGGFERMVAAVLVEKEEVVVAQEKTARLILNHISPKCEILVVHCH